MQLPDLKMHVPENEKSINIVEIFLDTLTNLSEFGR